MSAPPPEHPAVPETSINYCQLGLFCLLYFASFLATVVCSWLPPVSLYIEAGITILIDGGLLVLVLRTYGAFLKQSWPAFRYHIGRHLALTFAWMIGLKIINAIVTAIVTAVSNTTAIPVVPPTPELLKTAFWLILSSAPGLLIAPFIEEIFFRHLLYYQWRGRKIAPVMFWLSATVFGLWHWSNVAGQWPQLIPYAVIGIFLALIYRHKHNIWYNIMTHFFYNLVAVILLLFLSLILLLR
jgi:membrane protease YdiL (CAAX protease family)